MSSHAPGQSHTRIRPKSSPKLIVERWDEDEPRVVAKKKKTWTVRTLSADGRAAGLGTEKVEVIDPPQLRSAAPVRHMPYPANPRDYVLWHWTSGHHTDPDFFVTTPHPVAFYVGRTGAIFRFYDEAQSTSGSTKNGDVNHRAVPIEVANAGRLYVVAQDRDYLFHEDGRHDGAERQRYCRATDSDQFATIGRNHYATFTAAQMTSLVTLTRYLCARFAIPLRVLGENDRKRPHGVGSGKDGFHLVEPLKSWRGIVTHYNVATNHDDELLQFDWSLVGG